MLIGESLAPQRKQSWDGDERGDSWQIDWGCTYRNMLHTKHLNTHYDHVDLCEATYNLKSVIEES